MYRASVLHIYPLHMYYTSIPTHVGSQAQNMAYQSGKDKENTGCVILAF